MAPKKVEGAAPKKATQPTHPPYKDMIKDAIIKLKDRMGSSRQQIKKYVRSNNQLGSVTDAAFDRNINSALASGEKSGEFERPKGPSGPTKLARKGATASKPATASKAKTTTAKKPASKPTTSATKDTKPAAKKAAPAKKATTTKAAPNSSKSRETAAPKKPSAAPAVEDKKPVALSKTKSGRVSKGTSTASTKKAATKKAPTKKKETAKKADPSPKKAEAAA